MKRLFIMMFALSMIFAGGCGNAQNKAVKNEKNMESKKLVVYFSATGKAERAGVIL